MGSEPGPLLYSLGSPQVRLWLNLFPHSFYFTHGMMSRLEALQALKIIQQLGPPPLGLLINTLKSELFSRCEWNTTPAQLINLPVQLINLPVQLINLPAQLNKFIPLSSTSTSKGMN